MRPSGRTADQIIAAIAGVNHGVVDRRQLLHAGVTPDEIKHRLAIGALLREYPGVYRAGHRAPSMPARVLAAVRACGDGAVLSGKAAARLLEILKGAEPPPEVTSPREHRIPNLVTRRCRRLDPREVSIYDRVPVTTAPRTLVDVAGELSLDDLARA
jgi:hypothetical protein